MIFSSASPYPSPSYTLLSTSRARVPNPMLITASHASLLAAPRRSPRVLFYSSEQMNYSAAKSVTITAFSATAAAASSPSPSSSAAFEKPELLSPSPPRLDLRSEEEFISRIRKEAEDGKLPPNIAKGMEDLYHNYRNAVFRSVNADAVAVVKANMTFVLECVLKDIKEPFVFSQYHKAVREPFDYYTFGQNYIRPLVDFKNSYVGNVSHFSEMEEKLRQGENVVMMSNHQSEADPAVIALLLESTNRYLAENLIYVAGDRVITDPLCKPFSMGRDLICVFSKKHLYDEPDLTEMKIQANMKSLKDMVRLLRGGSKFLWIAPSGGRDRPDSVTKEWFPAAFDISATENMRRLINHSGVPCHIYPLAILCHDIMPPPAQVEKDIGEKRLINFHGTGISVLPKISFEEVTEAINDPEEAKKVFTETVYDRVKEQYNVLNCAINEKQGLQASTSKVSLSQSWL